MIGADKFLSFLEPPCSLESSIPTIVYSILGVMQIVAGNLIWLPKYRKSVAGFFLCIHARVYDGAYCQGDL